MKKLHNTFKQYLVEVKYYRNEDDWQEDVDDNGTGIGVCPGCGGEARVTSTGNSIINAKSYMECTECGQKGPPTTYR